MCTAISYKTKNYYFGRTLDNDVSYGEEVIISPRNFKFTFNEKATIENHYAIIGMAYDYDGYPLYYDAINEKGLGIAGLNFINNAFYYEKDDNKDNIAQYEFIPWILSQCKTVKEAKTKIKKINFLNKPYSQKLPLARLHWLISDGKETITVEAVEEGVKIYDNKVGVLTNNPTFDKQIFNLNNYLYLNNKNPKNTFSKKLKLENYSNGMGGLGLPGDLSSSSRFIRASFVKMNSVTEDDELSSVSQFFHILNSVNQVKGCCILDNDNYEYTMYTSCCNLTKGIYYYTTYTNHQINAVSIYNEDLNSNKLIKFPLKKVENINFIY